MISTHVLLFLYKKSPPAPFLTLALNRCIIDAIIDFHADTLTYETNTNVHKVKKCTLYLKVKHEAWYDSYHRSIISCLQVLTT